ncbi:hypothetical protein BDV93DRAFT_608030 [Ceratobasidium sp. AG-I]|nr:hypothetical protein BDV93DRAFT_608030 [Ceratobasidium sp. AG-I]
MAEYIRHIQVLELFSVGLDWSTVAFDRLESILLQGLPSTCCPNLAQLAQILSTCPTLRTISLERVQMSIPPNTVSPAPVNLEHLESLSLLEVDIPKILSIILPGRKKIDLTLKGFVDNDDTLNTFYRFISRADVQKLTLTLSEVRSDAALSQLLPSAMIFTPELERLALHDMNIRESEINILHDYSFSPNAQLMPPPISTLADLPRIKEIQLHSCIIHSPPEVFCNAIRNLLGNRLLLTDCNHSPTTQGVSGATESLELIDETSDFGMQMAESLPGRVSFSDQ